MFISIHAPAKGATITSTYRGSYSIISIHAPAKGATSFGVNHVSAIIKFQSTLPRRERRFLMCGCHPTPHISIHAPAKGATRGAPYWLDADNHFNPRSREGSDSGCMAIWIRSCNFNPRSREGSDGREAAANKERVMISIHAPAKGATAAIYGTRNPKDISIHAPAKGATPAILPCWRGSKISIHAPAKGATRSGICNPFKGSISIHAPAKGATFLYNTRYFIIQFQSTLPRRERRKALKYSFSASLISIHAPAKGATQFQEQRRFH